jgi:hypothetical protein
MFVSILQFLKAFPGDLHILHGVGEIFLAKWAAMFIGNVPPICSLEDI